MNHGYLVNELRSYYRNKQEVLFGYLFGSYAKNLEKSTSDVDVALYINHYNPELAFSYRQEESEKLQRLLDKEFDLVLINEAPPLLRHEIVKHGVLLKDQDHEFLVDYKVKSFYKYLDQLYLINYIFKKNKAKIQGEEVNGINKYS